ncbi:uncharacterized protein LOC126808841 isoform X2 [Patella vulgata]|uniref:uncharacterized protein LOC126808841 isoform X2 n=1 Tax=Patella vulgata TaxID=6465 RepID=UPI0024A9D12E|nr:uncharacterized protein LOC126808841 isoform X2 [Patella vulgata]
MPCETGRLPEEQYKKIQSNYTELVADIKYDPMGLARSLFKYEVFVDDDLEKITKEERRYDGGKKDAAAKLLDIVLNSGTMAYNKFINALYDEKYFNALFRLEPGFKRAEEDSTISDRLFNESLRRGTLSGIPPIQENIRTCTYLDKKNEDSPRLRTKKDTTMTILQDVIKKNSVKTRAFEEGLNILNNHFILGIIGAAGDGKTTLSSMIAYQFIQDNQQYIPLMINELDDLNYVTFNNDDDKYIFIIDDMYGKFNKLKERIDKWPNQFEHFRIRKEKGQLALIYIMRDYIYNSSKYQLDKYGLFSENTTKIFLHIGEFSLNDEERKRFLKFYNISSDTIISKIEGCFGFPAISSVCSKLKADSLPINLGSSHEFLLTELNTFWNENKDIYSTLLVVFCLHTVREEDLKLESPKGVRELTKKITENVYNSFHLNIAKENVNELAETFIKLVERNYLLREFVEAPFFCHFSEKCMDMALEYCSFELLMALTKTTGQPENQFIIIHERYYDYFSLRCLKELKAKNTGIFQHPAFLDNNFLTDFLTKDDVKVLLSDIKTISLGEIQGSEECGNFVHYISLYGDLECLTTVLENLKEHLLNKDKTNMNWDVMGLAAISMIEPIEKLTFLRERNYGDIVTLPHLAVYSGRFDIVQYVASFTVFDPRSLDNKSRTILHNACDSNYDVVEIIDFLVEKGFDINAQDGDGSTPLHLAVGRGKKQNVSILIMRGASVRVLDNNGRAPAHVICTVDDGRNDVDASGILNQLIEAGSPVNSTDKRERTPLLEAFCNVNRKCIRYLLTNQTMMVDTADEINQFIMYAASQLSDTTLFRSILDVPKYINTMTLFRCCQSLENLKALRSVGVDFHVVNDAKCSLLHESCRNGTIETVKFLINEVGLNINDRNINGQTPATYCCFSKINPVEKLKFLSLKGANLGAVDNNNCSLLQISCSQGIIETVKYLVNEIGLCVNHKDINGMTPAMYSAVSNINPLDKLTFLSLKGANLDIVNNNNCSLLHLSCSHGIIETVKYLVNEIKLNVNHKDVNGCTPAMDCTASNINPVDKLKFLSLKGANLDVVNNNNCSLLQISCGQGIIETVKYLVNEIELNVNHKDVNGVTPAMDCTVSNINPVDKLKFLSLKGANLDVVDNNNCSLLQISCSQGIIETVKYLVNEIELNVNHKDINGITPAMCCGISELNPVDKLTFLSLKGANLDVVDNNNCSLLQISCSQGIIETVKYLVNEIKLNVNHKDINGITPAMYCGISNINPVDKLKFLSLKGANLDVVNNNNRSLLHLSCSQGIIETVKYLVNEIELNVNHKDINGITPAMYCGISNINPVDKLKFLSLKGANLDVVNNNNRSLLHLSCSQGIIETVKYLVNEIELNVNHKDINGITPAMCCGISELNPVDKLTFLSLKGANLDVVDNNNCSLLHLSCSQGIIETVKYLVNEIELNVNHKDINGITPAMYCGISNINPVDKLKFLSLKGANLDVVNNNNRSLLHLSCSQGIIETVKYLVNEIELNVNHKDINGITPAMCCGISELNPVDKLTFLSLKGANLDVVDNNNCSLLQISCSQGIIETVKYLVNEIELNVNHKDINGITPAMDCGISDLNPVDKLTFLSLKGANLDVVDNNNCSLLQISCSQGIIETVKYLVNEIELNVNHKDINGITPAMYCGFSEINPVDKLTFLSLKGANLDVVDNNNCSLLQISCRQGIIETVKYLVNEIKLNVNHKDIKGDTPAMYCTVSNINPVDKLKFLSLKGANLDVVDNNNCSLLQISCRQGIIETVKYLVNEIKLNVNHKDIKGDTPAMDCTVSNINPVDKLKFLSLKGANLDVVDNNNCSLLQISCSQGIIETVKYLVNEIELNVNHKDINGITPAMCCGISDLNPVDKLTFLSLKGANLDVVDNNNCSLLHLSCSQGIIETVKYLVNEIKLNVNHKDIKGDTPAMDCTVSNINPVDKLKFLSLKGANLDVVDNNNRSLLHLSCSQGIIETVKYLVNEIELNVNHKDINGITPAMCCGISELNPVDKLTFLLLKGCKLDVVDNNKRSLLQISCRQGITEAVKYLVNEIKLNVNHKDIEGVTPTMDCTISNINPVDKLTFLLSKGANIGAVDGANLSLLQISCSQGIIETVKYLVNEIELNVNHKDINGMTPAMYCGISELNPVDKLTFLLLKGCKLDVVDNNKRSLLQISCRHGITETVKYLVNEIKLNVNHKDINGFTPAMDCTISNISPVDKLKFLSSKGVNLNIVDNNDISLLCHCCVAGTTETLNYLINVIKLDINLTVVMCCCMSRIDSVQKLKLLLQTGNALVTEGLHSRELLEKFCKDGTVETLTFLINEMGSYIDIDALLLDCFQTNFQQMEKINFLIWKGAKITICRPYKEFFKDDVDDCTYLLRH